MGDERVQFARGMTLIEVLMAAVVASVAATGVLSYEYHAARQTRTASAHSAAVRIGYMLLADWKANGGNILYADGDVGVHNPVELDMGFERIGNGVYHITIGNVPMQVTLSRDPGRYEYSRLIEIKAVVQWRTDFGEGGFGPGDQLIELTTYARVDQTGG